MVFISETHATRNDIVELLSLMEGLMDRLVLLLFNVGSRNDEWFTEFVIKVRCLMEVLEPFASFNRKTLACSNKGVAR